MSNEVVTLAQKRVVGSATKKAVLVYLADRASDDGSGIWTSKSHIAADTELSKRSVQSAMIEFERDGILKKVGTKKCQNGFTYEYELVLEAIKSLPSTRKSEAKETGAGDSPVQEIHLTGAGDSPHGVQEIHPNHPLTTHEPSNAQEREADLFSENSQPSKPVAAVDDLFNRFWKVFPKKAAKPKAQAAFAKAVKRAPAEIIIQRAERYAQVCVEKGTESKFIKHPQGWLNDDRWNDEDLRVQPSEPVNRYQQIVKEWGRG